ncbi:MAG: membrane protein insertase YidC [Verrucomicrobiae bacterium]|nr:membrane protein insertase YidC [Verrucomicrobiae bacterium]
MDRKTLPLIVLCIALIIFWQPILNMIFGPSPERPAPPSTNQVAAAASVASGETFAPPASAAASLAPAFTNAAPSRKTILVENEVLSAEMLSDGGGIGRITLKKFSQSGIPEDPMRVILNAESPLPVLSVAVGDADFRAAYEARAVADGASFVFRSASGLRIAKEFRLGKDYLFDAAVTLTNEGKTPLKGQSLRIGVGLASSGPVKAGLPYVAATAFSGAKARHEVLAALQKFVAKQHRPWELAQPIEWGAVRNQYFAVIVTPPAPFAAFSAEPHALAEPPPPGEKPAEGVLAAMASAPFDLAAGASTNLAFRVYAGPKEYRRLAALGQRQDQVLDLGMFEIISRALLWLMDIFHGVFRNWGVAIIGVTVVIKILFWPLTAISTRSMKQMQALAPKISALKEKHKDDAKKMNEEMMKLYRDYKVNPMAGCLPMLIQIPIFFAFYNLLRASIELRGAPFLWIHDLSAADTIAHLPGLDFPVNLMPLIMAVTMIWQTKMTPQTPNADPSMKMMMWMMPAMFLFFCYSFSSGLSLYWTVQNLLTILQTWLTRDKPVAPPTRAKPRRGFSFIRQDHPRG